MKRRDWIRTGLAAGAAGMLPLRHLGAAGTTSRREVRNIIFYAYDGLSWEDVAFAQAHARRHTGAPLLLHRLLRESPSGSQETYSLSSMVTDSAAAASAWSTGRKHVNYMINRFPDGRELTTILDVAKSQGRATGLVTTTRITHATPAAFVAKVASRDMEDEIAAQYLAFRPDVLLGGGARHFAPDRRRDGRDLLAEFAGAGYSVVRTAEQLERTNGSRLLGLFSNDHLPFEIDRDAEGTAPRLSAMARAALDVLSDAQRGFVLQVEAGRIDHSNHKNDAAATLHELLEADRTLAVLLAYVDAHDDTLLIMASDHATGGGAVYGAGRHYNDTNRRVQRLELHTASFDGMLAQMGRTPTAAEVSDVVRSGTGVLLSDVQAAALVAAIREGTAVGSRAVYADQPHNSLGFLLYGGGGGTADRANFSFATGQHIAGAVPIALYGATAAHYSPRFADNTDCFGWMTRALGAFVENPVLTEAQARELIGEQSVREAGAGVVHA